MNKKLTRVLGTVAMISSLMVACGSASSKPSGLGIPYSATQFKEFKFNYKPSGMDPSDFTEQYFQAQSQGHRAALWAMWGLDPTCDRRSPDRTRFFEKARALLPQTSIRCLGQHIKHRGERKCHAKTIDLQSRDWKTARC